MKKFDYLTTRECAYSTQSFSPGEHPTPAWAITANNGVEMYRYAYLDKQKGKMQKLAAEERDFNDILKARFESFGIGGEDNLDWIYKHNIEQVWEDYQKYKNGQGGTSWKEV